MSFFLFLMIVQAIIAAALVGVILIQRSEGGGLGVGGSPGGMMSARGAANFLTRMTAILAGLFILLSITLAVLATGQSESDIDTSLDRTVETAPAPAADPLAPLTTPGAAPAAPASGPAATATPAPAPADADPLAGAAGQ